MTPSIGKCKTIAVLPELPPGGVGKSMSLEEVLQACEGPAETPSEPKTSRKGEALIAALDTLFALTRNERTPADVRLRAAQTLLSYAVERDL